MMSVLRYFIVVIFFITLLCISIQQSQAECYVEGEMTASIVEDKWFGLGGSIKSYTITSVIYRGNRHAVPRSFPYVDRRTKNRYGATVCFVDARVLEFTAIENGGYEEVYISPKEVSFLCSCTD